MKRCLLFSICHLLLALALAAPVQALHAGPATLGVVAASQAESNAIPSPSVWQGIPSIVTGIDSMTSGADGVGTDSAWPTWLQARLPGNSATIYNTAIGGRTVQQGLDAFASESAPHLSAGSLYFWYGGNNDFPGTASAVYATAKSTWAAARATGAKVIVILNLADPSKDSSTSYDITRVAFRALVVGDPTQYDLVIDPSPWVPLNSVFFVGGGAHLTTLGAQTLNLTIYNAVNRSGLLP
ncbi:MAG: SGNH/GDSL hydrolase family protein [Chthoniobacter sp.]|nr:SGNH/GDSL hydrolase family protein [Chthoniobacter sp.]